MKHSIYLDSVSKRYKSLAAIENIILQVPEGRIMAILGPSGSGKSTLLKVVAGVADPTSGRIFIDNEDVTKRPIEQRDIGFVFQGYALFPHMSVLDNISFPLRTRRHRVADAIAKARVGEMIDLLGLSGCEKRKPRELSGGQQQRVALARALVFRPRVLLLDEPLAALDPALKETVLQDIAKLQSHLGISILYVTHDQQEAMRIAYQMAILRGGRLQQVGTPQAIYDTPCNLFVGSFLGEANILPGTIRAIRQETTAIDTPVGLLRVNHGHSAHVGECVSLLVRPEAISVSVENLPERYNRIWGNISDITFLGSSLRLKVLIGGGVIWHVYRSRSDSSSAATVGERVELAWDSLNSSVIGAETGTDLEHASTARISLSKDMTTTKGVGV